MKAAEAAYSVLDIKQRSTVLKKGWKFYLGEADYAYYKGHDDSGWQDVTLPHDWSVEHPFDRGYSSGTGYLCGGIGWYRLRFMVPEDIGDKVFLLTFGGVYKNSRVWCNTNYLGMRPCGYSTFSYDITPFITKGENVIAVRCEHVDLADSRWFTGNGIYRDVSLTVLPRLHFVPDEVVVSTLSSGPDQAALKVQWKLTGAAPVSFELLDERRRAAASAKAEGAGGEVILSIDRPRLWSPDSPALYTLVCRAGEDELSIHVGIRSFAFDSNRGFSLNGQAMKIKGVCLHHDAGALGAAVPRAVWQRRLQKLKVSGCNAIRTSHNPPDSHLLDLCDEMGFLVMDEAFDEWEGCKNKWWQGHNVYPPKHHGYSDAFPDWHEHDLAALIRRDRNHPCVILWSIGNEIDYPNDPYVHPVFQTMKGNNDSNKPAQEWLYDPNKPNARRIAQIAQRLVGIVKMHDTTRPVTAALAFPELSNIVGYADTLDIVGYNYKEQLYAQGRTEYPGRVIYGSENGHGVKEWLAVRDHEDICGQFLWTGVDYLGEAKGWPVRVAPAGLLTSAGFEKPRYFHRVAMWTQEMMVKLACCTQEDGADEAFAWDYQPGQSVRVKAYSNAESVELFLNGRSLGLKQCGGEYCAVFELPFESGTLSCIARRDSESAADQLVTPGAFSQISLKADKEFLVADGGDIAQVEISLQDSRGNPVVLKDELISYALVGDGEILGIENGAIDDLRPYCSKERSTYRGGAIVYIRSGESVGELSLYARAGGMPPSLCRIRQG